jgi:hypothetical protein
VKKRGKASLRKVRVGGAGALKVKGRLKTPYKILNILNNYEKVNFCHYFINFNTFDSQNNNWGPRRKHF